MWILYILRITRLKLTSVVSLSVNVLSDGYIVNVCPDLCTCVYLINYIMNSWTLVYWPNTTDT